MEWENLEKPTTHYNICPTSSNHQEKFREQFLVCLQMRYEAWATRNLTSDNFDMANNCKITGKPLIFCEQDCICRDRRNCSHPQWLTTRINCGGTIARESHHGDPDDSLAAYAVAASRALLNIMTGNPWTVILQQMWKGVG
jgi:hypothetical protein